jgi:tetratricopeptide (TPR) repeat protein
VQFEVAVPLLADLHRACRDRLVRNDPLPESVFDNLVAALFSTGQYNDASGLLIARMEESSPALGPAYDDADDDLLLLLLLTRAGRIEEALVVADRVVERAVEDPSSAEWVMIGSAVGSLLLDLGRAQEALPLIERALLEAEIGDHDPEVPVTLRMDLSTALHDLKQCERALPERERVVADSEQLNGRESHLAVLARSNLAATLIGLNRSAGALAHIEQALPEAKETFGRLHPDTARIRRLRGQALRQVDRPHDALAAFHDAREDFAKLGLELPQLWCDWDLGG